jgi:hypothetical protein
LREQVLKSVDRNNEEEVIKPSDQSNIRTNEENLHFNKLDKMMWCGVDF